MRHSKVWALPFHDVAWVHGTYNKETIQIICCDELCRPTPVSSWISHPSAPLLWQMAHKSGRVQFQLVFLCRTFRCRTYHKISNFSDFSRNEIDIHKHIRIVWLDRNVTKSMAGILNCCISYESLPTKVSNFEVIYPLTWIIEYLGHLSTSWW